MLKLQSLITPSAMLAALTLAAAPAFAQEKYHGRQSPSGQPSSGQQPSEQPSSGQGRERAQPRAEAPRGQTEGQPPQAGAAPAAESRQETARPRQPQQRPAEQPRAENRGTDTRENDNRRTEGRRENDRRDGIGRGVPRREGVAPRGTYAPHYEPGYAAPGYSRRSDPRYDRRGYAPHSHYRPYVFRPRYSFGYGFFAGYPVPYSYTYSSPIWVYGYRAPRERVMIMPGSPYYGGVALEMTPYDADVFVDGTYAGRVEDFDGSEQPLTLSAGMHEIEVQAQGYEPMRVNVEVQPGQIIPYRGDLRPY